MAFSWLEPIQIGSSNSGLTLKAKTLHKDGTESAYITTGFTEISSGDYTWLYSFDDDFDGVVKFYNAAGNVYIVVSDRIAKPVDAGDITTIKRVSQTQP